MTSVEVGVALLAWLVTVLTILHAAWDLATSYDYPPDVAGSRWREFEYSVRNRFAPSAISLLVWLPVLVASVIYVFVVGLRTILFG